MTTSPQDTPLTTEERDLASRIDIYAVWYEDRFSHDPAFVMDVFLTREEAVAHAESLGGRKMVGFDGYDADERPATLLWFFENTEVTAARARQLLAEKAKR
jgi:hypothetical protein